MKNKKKAIIAIIAVLTAVVGVAVAVGAYLKRKAEDISEKLDFDGDLYYEDDDYFDEESEDKTDTHADAPQDDNTNNGSGDADVNVQEEENQD